MSPQVPRGHGPGAGGWLRTGPSSLVELNVTDPDGGDSDKNTTRTGSGLLAHATTSTPAAASGAHGQTLDLLVFI